MATNDATASADKWTPPPPQMIRAVGHEAANNVVDAWTRVGYVYRGITEDEFLAHCHVGQIVSTGRYSLPGEGTTFSDDAAIAESAVNFGRDDPRRTGRPTFLLEVPVSEHFQRAPDGYYKTHDRLPLEAVSRVWRMEDRGGEIVATEIDRELQRERGAARERTAEREL